MELEDILVTEREEIEKLRRFLFPLVGFNVITGFNIYEIQFKSDTKYLVSYLHSDLEPSQEHYLELVDKIRRFADIDLISNMFYKKVDRYTSYKLRSGWTAVQYFNIKAEELTEEEAKEAMKRRETVIGVDIQGDMKIQIDDCRDLANLLNVFMEYTNAFVVDKQSGEYKKDPNISKIDKRVINRKAITNAWEVPLITVSANKGIDITPFHEIKEVGIDGHKFYLSILVDKKFQDLMFLLNQTHFNVVPQGEDKHLFANKIFVNWMNRLFYSKRYKDFRRLIRKSLEK